MTKLTGIITSESKLEGNLGVRNEINVGIIGTGPRGLPGNDGYTPIKGIDYFDGSDANVTNTNVVNALGYIPLSEDSLPDNLETTSGSQAKADQAEQNANNYTDQEISSIDIPDSTWESIQNKPDTFVPSEHNHTIGNITGLQNELNSKETPSGSQSKANVAESNAKDYVDGKVLTDVPINAKFTDTVYSHPSSHPANMITESSTKRFVSDTKISEWDGKETTTGSQNKANQAEQNAKNYTDSELASFEGMVEHGNEYHTENYATEFDLVSHKAENVSQGEIHGLRVENEKLEYYTGTEWKIASGGIPVGNISGFSVEEYDAEITLMWTDPEDRYLDDLKIAEWQGTKIIRKEGSYPVSDDDGVLVVDNKTRNQYSSNGYTDVGLTNYETYYYMAFPYTEDAITIDSANRISATPIDADDPSGSPGNSILISGTRDEGFFGEVSTTALITGDALASQVGISQGTSQHSTAGWLKFAYKGEILFVAKKPIRHTISWDAINTANCVYGDSGDKTVTIDGLTYKVTLMRALEPTNDPKTVASANDGEVNHGSEWNRLMSQIHEQALNRSWDYPDNVENDIRILEHNLGNGSQGMYSDADLIVANGDGRASWCQEMSAPRSSRLYRLFRGYLGVLHSYYNTPSAADPNLGWRPVLRLIG